MAMASQVHCDLDFTTYSQVLENHFEDAVQNHQRRAENDLGGVEFIQGPISDLFHGLDISNPVERMP